MATMHTGRQIKGVRLRNKWAQLRLGIQIGCSKERVSRLERGLYRINSVTAGKLRSTFNCAFQGLKPAIFDRYI